jgi:hypothetical protein
LTLPWYKPDTIKDIRKRHFVLGKTRFSPDKWIVTSTVLSGGLWLPTIKSAHHTQKVLLRDYEIPWKNWGVSKYEKEVYNKDNPEEVIAISKLRLKGVSLNSARLSISYAVR